MSDIVKPTIFYAGVDDFRRLDEVYARYMPDPLRRGRRPPTCGCRRVC